MRDIHAHVEHKVPHYQTGPKRVSPLRRLAWPGLHGVAPGPVEKQCDRFQAPAGESAPLMFLGNERQGEKLREVPVQLFFWTFF